MKRETLGAILIGREQCRFSVWGPELESVEVQILTPTPRCILLEKTTRGYWQAIADGVTAGTRYLYRINGSEERPDPASRYQPEGVHGVSEVVDTRQFAQANGGWKNVPLKDYVIYEFHVGTFTPEGTFAAAIARLDTLKLLGITAVEIMPVAQFSGDRNWGYDGAYTYAVQHSYGGPQGLQAFVAACHGRGLAVILDVVYNHFGPEGSYGGRFAPFSTERYRTPWGGAINFDDAWSDGIRDYFIGNALFWLRDYRIDALRLDAIQAIYDNGAKHVLAELSEAVAALSEELDKPHYLIAESDLNDAKIIRSRREFGYGIDAQWSDDLHHALHALLTGEHNGYYQDFGSCESVATALRDRFVHSGGYSEFRQRRHGNHATDRPSTQFVVCVQNHDQIGNRMMGERLSDLVSLEACKMAAGLVLTAPYLPLIFMGEEYAETAPFLYFTDHSDRDLIEAVRRGRLREFGHSEAEEKPLPANELDTFMRSKLNWKLRDRGVHRVMWTYYQKLLKLRKQLQLNEPALAADIETFFYETKRLVGYERRMSEGRLLGVANFSASAVELWIDPREAPWQLHMDSAAVEWKGAGSSLPHEIARSQTLSLAPESFVLYRSRSA